MSDLQQEATSVLTKLLQFNTVNPPGNERVGQEWLRDYLVDAGFECELRGVDSERPNLVARLKGEKPGPTLGYLSHMDTVLANPDDWERDPWSGDVVNGEIWGRGAIDMKNQTAAEAVAGASLARAGWRPKRGELKIICVADEEAGGAVGAKWLVKEHPDLAHCDMLINEGGWMFDFGERRLYGVSVAEKGAFRFSVKIRGAAGHASMPDPDNNPLLKLLPIVEHLGKTRLKYAITDVARNAINALGQDGSDPKGAIEKLRAIDPFVAASTEFVLGLSLAPTRIFASDKINVIPDTAELQVDCRFPPELNYEQVEEILHSIVREVAPEGSYELAPFETSTGSYSTVQSPLMDAIDGWVRENNPGSEAVPTVLIASSDSTAFRKAFPESVVYGFFPAIEATELDIWPYVHGKNERIGVNDLGFATKFFADLPRMLLDGS
jgi:acetylornithine deacetylase/succinyl-diaminopimelate desuccinylase-like protein